jgi:hypothetical protein
MNNVVPRGPLRDGEELDRFAELVQAAHQARLLLPQCDFFPQRVGEDVLVWCFSNRGGPPGKRYRHVTGWLQELQHDLRNGYFLPA